MIEGIPIAAVDGVGVVGVVLLFGIGLATGRVFTKRQYDDAMHDRDEWRAESRLKDAQILELTEQNTKMLNAFGPTLTNFLRELRKSAGIKAGADGGEDQ